MPRNYPRVWQNGPSSDISILYRFDSDPDSTSAVVVSAGAIPAWTFIFNNIQESAYRLAFYFALKGSTMKQTKDAGLVSCGLEEYLINKINADLERVHTDKSNRGEKRK